MKESELDKDIRKVLKKCLGIYPIAIIQNVKENLIKLLPTLKRYDKSNSKRNKTNTK